MEDLKGLLNSCNWTLSFDNLELQKKLGSKIEYCEADAIGTTIILLSPVLNKRIDINFCELKPITKGFVDWPEENQITVEPSGIIIKSKEYGTIRLVEYSEN